MWKMVLWGASYNAVVVVGVVSLLLFRLPMAILWCPVSEKEKVLFLDSPDFEKFLDIWTGRDVR